MFIEHLLCTPSYFKNIPSYFKNITIVDSYFNYHPQLSDDRVQLYPMLLGNRMKGSPLALFFVLENHLLQRSTLPPMAWGKLMNAYFVYL